MNSNYHWLRDPGHGGIIKNVYQTHGKRSPIWADGSQLFEGEFTRDISNRLGIILDNLGIRSTDIVNSQRDVSLRTRVRTANNLHRINHDCAYLSIHANAFSKESAHGWEVWTSKGETKSDKFATVFYNEMQSTFPDYEDFRPDTSDGDVDRESNFYVLKNTWMPAVLTENFFMTNWEDYKIITSEDGRQKIASAHAMAILKIEEAWKR